MIASLTAIATASAGSRFAVPVILVSQVVGHRGFLPTRGSWMLDFVFLAMFAIVPVLIASVLLVRYGRRYSLHKWLQLSLAATLLIAVAAFEVDMRFVTGDWRALAAASPYYDSGWVHALLVVHLCFAIPTPVLWGWVIVRALRSYPRPPQPGAHSDSHIFWARLATGAMLGIAPSGWVFYWMAFAL